MKTKSISILLMFIFLYGKGFAQVRANDSVLIKTRILSTSLFNYIPNQFNAGKANLSYELTTQGMNSLKLTGGYIYSYGFPNTSYVQIKSENCSGISVEIERKHYLKRKKLIQPLNLILWPQLFQFHAADSSISGYYFSTSFSTQFARIKMKDDFVDYIDDIPYPNAIHYTTVRYDVDRIAYAFNVKIGYNCIKSNRFTVDYALGLGVQFISSINNLNPKYTPNDIKEQVNFNTRMFNGSSGLFPSFVYQLNIGFCL